MLNTRLDLLTDYPFKRLAALLQGMDPGSEPIIMSIGEPQHPPPAMVERILTENASLWGKYPPLTGSETWRQAVAQWLVRRFSLPEGMIDADRQTLPVAGTREALFLFAQVVCNAQKTGRTPVVLMPNPFYQVYKGAALMAGAEPVLVAATRENGFMPDFSALPEEILSRCALAYLCNPSNPQGAVASAAYLSDTLALARRFGFVLAMDECYSEIYDEAAPAGILAVCAAAGGSLHGVVAFHSLSKRSSVPGLRSGFMTGDADLVARFARLRSYGGASVPGPVLAASAALWRDEGHVEENRRLYRAKIDAAEEIIGGRFGFFRPPGGFFLWLNVGDGEAAARVLWQRAGIKVLPGAYLADDDGRGVNPGTPYVRVALVHDIATTRRALGRMRATLESRSD